VVLAFCWRCGGCDCFAKHGRFVAPGVLGSGLRDLNHCGKTIVVKMEAEFGEAAGEGRFAAVLAQHEPHLGAADGFGKERQVGFGILEQAILMDTRGGGENVRADHRFVDGDGYAGELGNQAAERGEARGIDAGTDAEFGAVQRQQHHKFFERSVARAFADAVDGALHDVDACFDRGQRVGCGESEVVVEMHGQHGAIEVGHTVLDAADEVTDLRRAEHADRIRKAEHTGAGVDGFPVQLAENGDLRAAGVFRAEGNGVEALAGVGDGPGSQGDQLRNGLLQLVLAVRRAGADKKTDGALVRTGVLQGFPGQVYVRAQRAAQCGHVHLWNSSGDLPDGVNLAGGTGRKSGVDGAYTGLLQRACDLYFLCAREGGAWHLFAIAERGVTEVDDPERLLYCVHVSTFVATAYHRRRGRQKFLRARCASVVRRMWQVERENTMTTQSEAPTGLGEAQLFLLSASDEAGLGRALKALSERAAVKNAGLEHLARRYGRAATDAHRMALVAASAEELSRKLGEALHWLSVPPGERRIPPGIFPGTGAIDGKMAFLFPGQGSQFPGMLQELSARFASVRAWVETLDAAYVSTGRARPSEVLRGEASPRLHDMPTGAQLGLVASMATTELLQGAGIVPDCMVGHSNGERAALLAAGALGTASPAAACAEFARVGLLAERMRTDPEGEGMLAVMAGRRGAVEAVLARYPETLFLAISNSPSQVVLGGRWDVLQAAAAELKRAMALCTLLPFERAFHTPLVSDWASTLRQHLKSVPFHRLRIPVYSTLTAERFPEDADGVRDCMARQWSSTVRFRETVEQLYKDGVRLFVEVGPDAKLSALVQDILRGRPHLAVSASSSVRGVWAHMLQTFAALYAAGVPVQMHGLEAMAGLASASPVQNGNRAAVAIRAEHARTLERIAEAERAILQRLRPQVRGPYTGNLLRRTATEVVFRVRLSKDDGHPYVRDHALGTDALGGQKLQVVPFTYTVALLQEAARRAWGEGRRLRNVRAHRWLALDGGSLELEIEVTRERARVFALQGGAPQLAFEAELAGRAGDAQVVATRGASGWVLPVCAPASFYRDQVFHGPSFHCIRSVQFSGGMVAAEIEPRASEAASWDVDPALLDCAGQLVAYWMLENGRKDFGVFPVSMEAFESVAIRPRGGQRMTVQGEVSIGSFGLTSANFEFSLPTVGVVWRVVNFRQTIMAFPGGIRPWMFGKQPSRFEFGAASVQEFRAEWATFLESGQGIWSRVLAHGMLPARELETLHTLPAAERLPRMVDALGSVSVGAPL